ncbi:MAG: AraC family transcriptional regulator, partial [Bacteroidota bacterium]
WVFRRNQQPIASDPPIKYANSLLDQATAQANMQRVESLMQEEKVFLDPKLSLVKLSQRLGISRKVLSQSINQMTASNYSKYVAGLRVAEAKRLLRSPDHQHLKIAAIGHASGFNSLSSFNATFKDLTGITPLRYQKKLVNGQ